MRVGFISQWYAPENVWVPESVVSAMRDQGHEVVVLTGAPHYPTGEVAAGYSASEWRTEQIDGVTVHRVPEFPYRGTELLGRLANYSSFATTATIEALRELRQCDVLLVYGSPATAALPALVLRLIAKVPYVLQVQDVWPDSVIDSGFVSSSTALRAIRKALHLFVSSTYAAADQIVAISRSAAEMISARPGAHGKVTVVHNWSPDPRRGAAEVRGSLRARIGTSPDTRVFIYAGALGTPQSLPTLVRAFIAAGTDAHLVLMGSGTDRAALVDLAANHHNVHVLPAAPLAEATALTRESDVALVSLADTPLHRATFPSKVQFLCGLGMPILVAAPGDSAAYVVEHDAGFSADPADSGSVMAAFRSMAALTPEELEALGRAARAAYETDFAPVVGGRALSLLLEQASQTTTKAQENSS